MGKVLLVSRLVARDLRHRPAQAILLLLAITAATSVLTLGLALHGVTSQPYRQTRAVTKGPDVLAYLPVIHQPGRQQQAPARGTALIRAPGVTGHSGPYPLVGAVVRAGKLTAGAEAEGRAESPAAVDQPKLTAGTWVRSGSAVLERTFAEALGVGVGDRVTLNGRPFTVAGTAVTAANPPYPNLCYYSAGGCHAGPPGPNPSGDMGLLWLTEPDAGRLATSANPVAGYVLNLKLKNPATAQAFASRYGSNYPGAHNLAANAPVFLTPWQGIAAADGLLVQDEQQVLSPGAWLAGLLALASVAVLAGGRMAEHTRRVGLLKAVGGTPGLVTVVLLAENVVLALLAAAAGLAIGWLAAPLITSPGAGLVGTPGAPSLTLPIVAEVLAVALVVALAATLVSAIRAARTSTVSALANAARLPRRRPRLIALSARLPVPLLLGLRLVARRPRRALLSAASIAVTVTGIVAVLAFHTTVNLRTSGTAHGLGNPVVDRDEQMLQVLTVVLIALAVLNAVFTAWATVLDARRASALARALGATPRQVSAGISAAQVIPALPGALLGIPLGLGLFKVASHVSAVPPTWWLAAAVLGTLVAVAGLTSIPARIGGRRPVAEVLQAELA
ncbi:MAG TPA: FtsX-like permease family protein [Streptosporangiaceae bacterium]|jgi:putative ABC transport system permease protein